MRPISFDAAWLASRQHQCAIVQCSEIRYSDDDGSTGLHHPELFMKRPNPVFQVLQHLIRNDKIKEIVSKRKLRSLEVQRKRPHAVSPSGCRETLRRFDAVEFNAFMIQAPAHRQKV